MENLTNSVTENEMPENYSYPHLFEIRKWSMFLSVLGFIFLGILLVFSLVIISGNGAGHKVVTIIPMLLMGIIYFFPIYYLFQFSNFSKKALMYGDKESFSTAFKYLKMHYRFMGIFTISVLGLYLIFFCFLLISGNMSNIFKG